MLVAANVCAVVARELRAGEAPGIADDELFAELLEGEGGAPELARRIREGDFDDRVAELADRLAEHVRRKLEVARPGYDAEG